MRAGYIVGSLSTYAEVSPSGTGLRVLGWAEGEKLGRKFNVPDGDGMSVEVYRGKTAGATSPSQACTSITPQSPGSGVSIAGSTRSSPNWAERTAGAGGAGENETGEKAPGGKKQRRPRGGQARLTAILEAGVGPSEQYPPNRSNSAPTLPS